MNESVVVGSSDSTDHTLKVTVIAVRRDRVRLGFEAAAGVAVHRWEVWEKIRKCGVADPAEVEALPVA